MKQSTYLFLLFFLFFSCNQKDSEPTVLNLTPTEKSAKIISADNQFGFEIFKKVNASLSEPKNIMISPMSISLALAMVYNGTSGETRTQMEKMLHKSGLTPDDINQSYKDLVAALSSRDPKVELEISNAIFYRNTFSVKNDFVTTNQNYYQAEVAGLDFTKTAETLNKVNGWVSTKTKGKINEIIGQVNPNDIMYILNAIYFNGEWQYGFDPKATTNIDFTKEDQSVIQAPMMFIENQFKFYTHPSFQMLGMPYGSGKYSMLVFLPNSGKTTNDVISLLNAENVEGWVQKSIEQTKRVYLPKFEFKFEDSLVNKLKVLGMTDAFDAAKANLTGISEATRLLISDVMHKSYIKVDERGTEAAAVTGITVGVTAYLPDNIFAADHPFVFAIRENDTKAILFIGKVLDPKQN
jgi:serpin B